MIHISEAINVTDQNAYTIPDFIFPGLSAGQVGLLSGPGGLGKSFLMLELGLSIATGKQFFEGLVLKQKKVRIINFEEDTITLQNRLISILKEFSLKDVSEHFLCHSCQDSLNLQEKESIDFLNSMCEDVDLLILDPVSQIFIGDENSSLDVKSFLKKLKQIAVKNGVAIILVHHSTKSSVVEGRGKTQQSVRGSGAFTYDTRLTMTLSGTKSNDIVLNFPKANNLKINEIVLRRTDTGVLAEKGRKMSNNQVDKNVRQKI